MREIKFRGKALPECERDGIYGWLYGDYSRDVFCGDKASWITPRRNNKSEYRAYRVEEATVGQYIGLKDKNGREIYEGDIVEWDGQSMDTYEIIYGDDASFFGVPINGDLKRVCGESLSLLNADISIVVVGNVHDIDVAGVAK